MSKDPSTSRNHDLPETERDFSAADEPRSSSLESDLGSSILKRFPALGKLKRKQRKRRIPYIQQTSAADCGAACLAMVLGYHGKLVNLEEVRTAGGIDSQGTDAFTLIETGNWFGLRGRGVKVHQVSDLKFLEPGTILHWGFQHYVVMEGWKGSGASIVDPRGGRRFEDLESLRKNFTGIALSFEPGTDFEPEDRRANGVWRYLRQILGQSGVLSRIITTSFLLQLFVLAIPLLTGLLVDRVVPRGDRHLLLIVGLGLGFVTVFHFLSSWIRALLILQLRTQLDARMSLDFLDHLVDLPYNYFQQRSAGDLIMRMNSLTTIREILTTSALSGVLDGLLVVLYLAILFLTNSTIGLLVLGLGALQVLTFVATRRRQGDLMAEALQVQARSRGYQVQLLAGIETIKAAGTEKRAVELWSNIFVDELNVSLDRGRLNSIVDSVLSALSVGSPLIILFLGGFLVMDGKMTLGTMLAASALAGSLLSPLRTLVSTALQLLLLNSYLERINDVLDTSKEQQDDSTEPARRLSGKIDLESISFRYSPITPEVVRDVSLNIEAGQFVALVGLSGSGKSTLANLLVGLFLPSEGRILYDSVDLKKLNLRSVRSQLGIVTQQPYLFGSSVRANIALSEPSIPLRQVEQAAKMAHIHDDIVALPMGYETVLADGGTSLSGGQRQRIALARALVRRPSIVLLDEATSALDAVTEAKIHLELSKLDCTRIIIAHRLSTIREADLILVLDEGKLVEQGRHDELLKGSGRYRELVEAQLDREQSTAP